jgi:hypothetical protein
MLNWFENLLFHYEFACAMQHKIQGMRWRKAWQYDHRTAMKMYDDPVEAAVAEVHRLRHWKAPKQRND